MGFHVALLLLSSTLPLSRPFLLPPPSLRPPTSSPSSVGLPPKDVTFGDAYNTISPANANQEDDRSEGSVKKMAKVDVLCDEWFGSCLGKIVSDTAMNKVL